MGMVVLRAVAWVTWACKPSAYLTIDRNERPWRETAGAFCFACGRYVHKKRL
jgi:hypothetical protein